MDRIDTIPLQERHCPFQKPWIGGQYLNVFYNDNKRLLRQFYQLHNGVDHFGNVTKL